MGDRVANGPTAWHCASTDRFELRERLTHDSVLFQSESLADAHFNSQGKSAFDDAESRAAARSQPNCGGQVVAVNQTSTTKLTRRCRMVPTAPS